VRGAAPPQAARPDARVPAALTARARAGRVSTKWNAGRNKLERKEKARVALGPLSQAWAAAAHR